MLRDINSSFWSNEVFNGAIIRQYSEEEGINPIDFERQIWHYDTLHILKEHSDIDLFFKGGTCVQSLLPLNFQRFSIDLDFNIETENRRQEAILSYFQNLNEKLKEKDLLIPVSETRYKTRSSANLIYGKFYPRDFDLISGTITFYRLLFSKVVGNAISLTYRPDLTKRETVRGVFNHILVQVNIKHHPPAFKSDLRDIELKIHRYPEYKKDLQFKSLSLGDLFADKLMAFRNRKKFKDLYDLGMMVKIIEESDLLICKEKINSIVEDNKKMIRDVVNAISRSLANKEYKRYLHGLPREVAPIIRDRIFYTGLTDFLQ